MNYEMIDKATQQDGWQKTLDTLLRTVPLKARRPNWRLLGPPAEPHERKTMVFLVSPSTRHELAAWKQFGYQPLFQHVDVPDDEVWAVHMSEADVDTEMKDAQLQPVSERWYRAWVIAGKPGAFGQDPVIQIHGHLHHAETR